jgi:hypothetical protein
MSITLRFTVLFVLLSFSMALAGPNMPEKIKVRIPEQIDH